MGWATGSAWGAADGASAWADGYVVDTSYNEPMPADLCPAWLSMVAVLHGQPPLDLGRPLTWVDLGSGSGVAACMVAAANDDVRVWGCDYNPTHVVRARQLVERAGLENCQFDEASFGDVAADDRIGPAAADVIVVHGVYSWVSRANQRHIVEIIRRRLRPGGLAVVLYETPTGWSSMVPLAEALRLQAAEDGRRSDLAFHDAGAAVRDLVERSSFPMGSAEAKQMASWAGYDGLYAAHEYLGGHFAPIMFDEVATPMAAAKCSFVGGMEPADGLSQFWVPPGLTDAVTGVSDLTVREMVRDLVTQRQLRRDVYRRGLTAPHPSEVESWVRDLTIEGLGKPLGDAPVQVPAGKIALDPVFYEPLVGALTTQALDIDLILDIHTDWTLGDAVVALSMLVSGGYAAPGRPGGMTESSRAASRRLNEVLLAENGRGADHAALVAPALGSAVPVDYVGMVAVAAVWGGAPADPEVLVDHVEAELARLGRLIRQDAALVEDPDEARVIVTKRVQDVVTQLEVAFPRLGV